MKRIHPLYLALDFEEAQKALHFLEVNHLSGIPVKVGMEMYYKEGPAIVHELKRRGHAIFLDLKLHDIPVTVKRAMSTIAGLGVDVVNVHAQGGSNMIAAAREGLERQSGRPLLLAVTQLTSTDEEMLKREQLVPEPMEEVVAHYAGLSKRAGADGVVCSVREVESVRRSCGAEFITLTPGIRAKEDEKHDQKRVATPFQAGIAGSHAIVAGRSIKSAQDPLSAYESMKKELENGRQAINQ
ncbi:orotidine-5'-phosphate decarboxylase [Halobacillus salinarum]|uniref:Orotidine 5'-phosphate decarboxylase n=1 Tax=Halobacillus salinarum TaxID=2932257 RepID=A0ABY4ERY2_9BACI|nr:orotidine-5'-phosphate decarboxylase [Halobacillus salinarum]